MRYLKRRSDGSLLLALTGPGKYSLDNGMKQRKLGAEAVLN
jgi:uncharacterized membrane protein YphA (DoxX/SURF4 family)